MNREKSVFEFGDFRLDAAECTLSRDQRTIPLEPQVFETLLVLVAKAGHLVEKSKFFDEVWSGTMVEEGNLVRNISLLRKALGEAPGGGRYIETVPKRGYRFVACVRGVDSESVDSRVEVVGPRQSVSPSRKETSVPRGPGRAYFVAAVIAGLLLVVALTPWMGIITTAPPGGDVQTSIAVLPFQPADIRDEALARGMTEALIDKLSMIPQLSVRPLGVVRRYSASHREPLEIGREMGVETVLESTLQQESGRILVLAQLMRVKDGRPLWSFRSAEPQSELLDLQDRLSEKVASSLVAQLSTEQRRLLRRQYTESPEAYQLYLKGRYFFDKVTPDGVRKSISYFEDAIDKDPDYALAYTGICASYTLFGHLRVLRPREVYPAAKAALARALARSSGSRGHSRTAALRSPS